MAFVIDMEELLDLANLPPDIIRIIIRTGMDSAHNMQLISQSWKWLVQENDRKPLPLERVYLFAAVPMNRKYENKRVHMYAIIPERLACRAGVGRWLKVFRRHSGGAVEVKCQPKHIGTVDPWNDLCVLCLILLCIPVGIYYLISARAGIVLSFPFAILILSIIRKAFTEIMEERTAISRLSRFFSHNTHLQTLVIGDQIDDYIFTAVHKTMEKVRIYQLEYRVRFFDSNVRERIIKLCQQNGVGRVCVTADDGNSTHFFRFVIEIAKLGVVLDIYETIQLTYNGHFRESQHFWYQMEFDLKPHQISMKFTTMFDASFNPTNYPADTKAHIQIAQCESHHPFKPSRGFIRG